jgi:hypothetical protein
MWRPFVVVGPAGIAHNEFAGRNKNHGLTRGVLDDVAHFAGIIVAFAGVLRRCRKRNNPNNQQNNSYLPSHALEYIPCGFTPEEFW